MKYCKNCKVKVDANRNYCPLCFRELIQTDDKTNGEHPFAERRQNETNVKNNSFILKFFIFLSICAVSICSLINFLVNPEFLWCALVAAGIIYVWILISHTILSRRGVFEKIFMQLLGLTLILWACENLSYESHWLANYVFPSLSIVTMATLIMLTLLRKDKSWILAFVFIIGVLFIASLLLFLYLADKQQPGIKILGIINLTFSSLTALGYFVFGFNTIKTEFLKKFHL